MNIILLGLCLAILFMPGCQREYLKKDESLLGIWKFKSAYANFPITQIQVNQDKFILSYDMDQDGKVDYNWPHEFLIHKRFCSKFIQLKTQWDKQFLDWCRYEIDGDILKLFLAKGTAEFILEQ